MPAAVDTKFTMRRIAAAPDLAPFVERFWIIRWQLDEPYQQETLPNPCVNLVIGTHQPGLFGPMRRRFVAELRGRGGVIGTKFTPAGFRAFYRRPLVELVDRSRPVAQALRGGGELVATIERLAHDDAARIAVLEEFLRELGPAADATIGQVNEIVELARAEPTITRVDELGARVALPRRSLERLFREYVGLAPKWVIQRFRVHEAAERVAGGATVEWAELANALGYCDQAHFIRSFKAQIGKTPAQYAAACAELASAARPSAAPDARSAEAAHAPDAPSA